MKRLYLTSCLVVASLVLTACSGTEAINLNKENGEAGAETSTAPDAAAGTADAAMPTQSTPANPQAAAAAIADARVHFASALGTPAEALSPLQNGLNQRARERGLSIETSDKATLVVNGYFSTVEEDRQTLVIYVWDVTDKAGNRLHRLQGQERVSGNDSGWQAVDAETMTRIGQKTVDGLLDWLSRSRT